LELVVASTDLGYAGPVAPAVYRIGLHGGLTVPTRPAHRIDGAHRAWPWAIAALALALLGAAAIGLAGRSRRRPSVDPELTGVPLVVSGLRKSYGDELVAVNDLSFRVEREQILGLLGPNGAGKTTTLRMLMGLIAPSAGELRVFGHRVAPGAAVLTRVGAFVEGPGMLPHLSGLANLTLYWRATGRPESQAHAAEALEIAGLGDAVQRKVRSYSHGMRQRLAIAQAMLGLPDLLVLDEPTNGLDPPQIRALRDVLRRYATDGRTVVVSSHLLAEVEQTCSHVIVMDRGRLVAAGAVADIAGAGNSLTVVVDNLDRGVTVLSGLSGVDSAVRDGGELVVTLGGASAAEVVAALSAAGLAISTVAPRRRLEDAFVSLIGEK
jgi:ABC-2 type transport system ATP-binding protein